MTLPALPLLLAACFELDVDVDLARSGKTTVTSEMALSADATRMLTSLSPELGKQARTAMKEATSEMTEGDVLPPGVKFTMTPLGGKELGMRATVKLPRPSVEGLGDAGMGTQAMTLRDLGGGLWELSYGSPGLGSDPKFEGLKGLGDAGKLLGGLGGLGGGGTDGAAALGAALGMPRASATITVPGVIEAIEPPGGDIRGGTVAFDLPLDLDRLLDEGVRYSVRFRTKPSFRFPADAVTP